MAVDDVAIALIELHEAAVRARIARGVRSEVRANQLDGEEERLIVEAAFEDPDIEEFDVMASRYQPLLAYVARHRNELTPSVRKILNEFLQERYGDEWTIALMG